MAAEAVPPANCDGPLLTSFERMIPRLDTLGQLGDPDLLLHHVDLRLLELGISVAQGGYFETGAYDMPGSQRLVTSTSERISADGISRRLQRLTINQDYKVRSRGETHSRVADYFIDFASDSIKCVTSRLETVEQDNHSVWELGPNSAPRVVMKRRRTGVAGVFMGINYSTFLNSGAPGGDGDIVATARTLLADLAPFVPSMRQRVNEVKVELYS